jgi:hypothetical protein
MLVIPPQRSPSTGTDTCPPTSSTRSPTCLTRLVAPLSRVPHMSQARSCSVLRRGNTLSDHRLQV